MFYALQVGRVDLSHAASRGVVDAANALDIVDRILSHRYDGTMAALVLSGQSLDDMCYSALITSDQPVARWERGETRRFPITEVDGRAILAHGKGAVALPGVFPAVEVAR